MFTKIQFWLFIFLARLPGAGWDVRRKFWSGKRRLAIDHYSSSKDFQPLIAIKTLMNLDFYWWKTSWNS